MRFETTQDVQLIRPLLTEWLGTCNAGDFRLDTNIEVVMADLQATMAFQNATIIVARRDEPKGFHSDHDEIVGFFVVMAVPSTIGAQNVAVEKYWYVKPSARWVGVRLFKLAHRWAKDHDCTHFIVNASNLASDMHEKVAGFCAKMKMKLFETTYIGEIDGDDNERFSAGWAGTAQSMVGQAGQDRTGSAEPTSSVAAGCR